MSNNTELSWLAAVMKLWGKQWNAPEIAYRFSNNREFNDSTKDAGAFYEKS